MADSTLTSERLASEWKELDAHFNTHCFRFCDLATEAHRLEIQHPEELDEDYIISIYLKNFPAEAPDIVMDHLLLDKEGQRLDLSRMLAYNDEQDRTHIWPYNPEQWEPVTSLSKVVQRCCFWLKMYQEHLLTGKEIIEQLGSKS